MWPALIAGGAQLLGGYLNQQNQQSINQQNLQQQLNFAQNGIQWKVADAQKAGISPIYALGNPTASFSNLVGDNSFGNSVSQAGQDLSRAFTSTATKDDQHSIVMNKLQEQRGELENTLLASQVARLNNAGGSGPPTPAVGQSYVVDGQGSTVKPGTSSTATIKVAPASVTPVNASDPSSEPSANPYYSWVRTGPNSWQPSMSSEMAHRTSNDTIANMRFRLVDDIMGGSGPPSGVPLKRGYMWAQDPLYGWHQVRTPDRVWEDWMGRY